MRGQRLALSLALLLASSLPACNRSRTVEAARDDRPVVLTPAEHDFMTKALEANLAEMDMARIALAKSTNEDVKDYATMIRKDHKSAVDDLTDLMVDKNVPQQRTLVEETQQDISRMSTLKGAEFDREFANMMVSDHRKVVGMFRDQQATAQNTDITDYIDNKLPKLEMHLDKAQQLQAKLFGASK